MRTKLQFHWGAAALAHEHIREQAGKWVCDCGCCSVVRTELENQATGPLERATTSPQAPGDPNHAGTPANA